MRSRTTSRMTGRRQVPAGTKFEDAYGYSRAIRIGDAIVVSGTTALGGKGKIAGKDDMYSQTVVSIRKIETALGRLGADLDDVVRTRIYTTDISRWREIARGHRESFGKVKPTSILVEVRRLIEPDALVEIEVEAIVRK